MLPCQWSFRFSCLNNIHARNICICLYQDVHRYTQLFGADPEKVKALSDNFEKLKSGIANQNADKRNNNLIYLTAMTEAYAKGERRTPNNNICKGAQAFVIPIDHMQFYEDMQKMPARFPTAGKGFIPPGNAYIINFCQAFFDAPDLTAKLYNLEHGGKKEDLCNLKNLDTTGIRLEAAFHIEAMLTSN
jgi:hypothetical protein